MENTARKDPLTYARVGVDRALVHEALQALLGGIRYRPTPDRGKAVAAPGHYAGMIRVGAETIAITTDTVGTKVLLAEELGEWEEVGEDIVGVNVNDLAAVGARPIGLVDVISCVRPEPRIFAAIGRGIDRGLRSARCSLLGGETAIVPDIVRGTDLGGTAIGYFPGHRSPILGKAIRPGDVIVGIPSTGLHSNGYTLVRRILKEGSVDLSKPRVHGALPLGKELLRPTRIYTAAAEAVGGLTDTHGFAHITGGGVRNLVRLRSKVLFELSEWPAPAGIFAWLIELGALELHEAYQTFNMGIGFVVVTAPRRLSSLLRRLARVGAPDARIVGKVRRGSGISLPQLDLTFDGFA